MAVSLGENAVLPVLGLSTLLEGAFFDISETLALANFLTLAPLCGRFSWSTCPFYCN